METEGHCSPLESIQTPRGHTSHLVGEMHRERVPRFNPHLVMWLRHLEGRCPEESPLTLPLPSSKGVGGWTKPSRSDGGGWGEVHKISLTIPLSLSRVGKCGGPSPRTRPGRRPQPGPTGLRSDCANNGVRVGSDGGPLPGLGNIRRSGSLFLTGPV